MSAPDFIHISRQTLRDTMKKYFDAGYRMGAEVQKINPTRCPACGCQVFDPMTGNTTHNVNECFDQQVVTKDGFS